jgi:hypothetical protein
MVNKSRSSESKVSTRDYVRTFCSGLHRCLSQVQIFLNWTRFVVEDVLPGRPHVFINMDETQVSSIKHNGQGLVALNKVKRDNMWSRPKLTQDRTDVKTSLMGTVCDCPALQPFLPQVMLPKYTKRCVPPPAFP